MKWIERVAIPSFVTRVHVRRPKHYAAYRISVQSYEFQVRSGDEVWGNRTIDIVEKAGERDS